MEPVCVEVVRIETDEVIERFPGLTENVADRVERGILINLNHEEFYTRQVPDSTTR